jgi:hypothetical protein
MHFQDFEGSAHGVTATHEKLICADCHNAHTLQGGPGDMVAKYGATSTSPAASNTAFGPGLSGIEYVDTATIPGFQSQPYTYVYYPGNYGLTGPSNMALQTDLVCLRCHASHTFGLTQLEIAQYAADPASAGGVGESNGIVDGGVISNVTINGVVLGADGGPPADTCVQPGGTLPDGGTLPLTSDETCASQQAVASAVEYHMLQYAGMPAPFDPTGVKTGLPIGRCASCHMAKTAATGQYFEDLDSTGRTANVIGDVSSHPFAVAAPNGVALPSLSLPSWNAATTGQWQEVMPNACGSCHADYRLGK